MATATGPNLATAKAAVEKLMDDTCVITRNPSGLDNAVLDQGTGQLTDDDPVQLYSGRCLLSAPGGLGVGEGLRERGGAEYLARTYKVSLPLGTIEFQRGDRVVITSSRRDPLVVGKEMVIKGVISSTFAVSRKLVCESQDD